VRRPVHPTALRLLLLRLLYRGPERRRKLRVAVGTAIRYRRALLWRSAMLTELSSSGCRLLAARGVPAGGRVRLELPDPASPAAPLRVRGRVLRSNVLGPSDPTHTLAVEFRGLKDAVRARVEQIVAAARGGSADVGPAVTRPVGARAQAPASLPPTPRVVTLSEGAHVVMGRDLSRWDPHQPRRSQRDHGWRSRSMAVLDVVVQGTVARDEGGGRCSSTRLRPACPRASQGAHRGPRALRRGDEQCRDARSGCRRGGRARLSPAASLLLRCGILRSPDPFDGP
jgi:hypothetical protein